MRLAIGSLASGSSGNCYLVKTENTSILVDAGISAKQIVERLKNFGEEELPEAVLITHEHSDHIQAVPQLLKRGIKLYASEKTFYETKSIFQKNLKGKEDVDLLFDNADNKYFKPGDSFVIGDILVNSFPTSHDAIDPCGFSFSKDDATVSIITDTGVLTPDCYKYMAKADVLVLESNHDVSMLRIGKYPWFLKQRILSNKGHLSNDAAAEGLAQLMKGDVLSGTPRYRMVLLAHLSKENNFPQMAMATMSNILESEGFVVGKDVGIETLSRTEQGKLYIL